MQAKGRIGITLFGGVGVLAKAHQLGDFFILDNDHVKLFHRLKQLPCK